MTIRASVKKHRQEIFDGVPIEWNFLVQVVPVSMHTSLCRLKFSVPFSVCKMLAVFLVISFI